MQTLTGLCHSRGLVRFLLESQPLCLRLCNLRGGYVCVFPWYINYLLKKSIVKQKNTYKKLRNFKRKQNHVFKTTLPSPFFYILLTRVECSAEISVNTLVFFGYKIFPLRCCTFFHQYTYSFFQDTLIKPTVLFHVILSYVITYFIVIIPVKTGISKYCYKTVFF